MSKTTFEAKEAKQSTYVAPVVTLSMEIVTVIEQQFTLGDDGKTIGERVDKMIRTCMDNHDTMRSLTVDLSEIGARR